MQTMNDEIRELEEITGMRDLRPNPDDLWSLFDAPHVRTLEDPDIFLSFARSESTESVSSASMAGMTNFRAVGPHGGTVNFVAAHSSLAPYMWRELREVEAGKAFSTSRAS